MVKFSRTDFSEHDLTSMDFDTLERLNKLYNNERDAIADEQRLIQTEISKRYASDKAKRAVEGLTEGEKAALLEHLTGG